MDNLLSLTNFTNLPGRQIGESLPPEASRLLYHLEPSLPARLAEECATGIHSICSGNASSWASPELEEQYAIMNPYGHGWHLGRAAFDELLRESVSHCAQREQSVPRALVKGRFKQIEKESTSTWVVHVEESESEFGTFRAKWVVDASGRRASVVSKVNNWPRFPQQSTDNLRMI